jgi:putative inorganic carbon (hco3(-)) transporter
MSQLLSPFPYVLFYVAMWYVRLHEYPDSPIQFPILTILQGIAIVLWAFGPRRSLDVPQTRLLPILMLSMFVSTVTNGWAGGVVTIFAMLTPTFLCYYMIAGTADSLQKLNQLAWVIALSVGIIGLHGILESQTGVGWSGAEVVEGSRITYVGLLNDPNDLAMALLMAFPLQVYLLTTTRSKVKRLLLLACMVTVLWSTYLTNSRGATLGFAAMLLTYSLRRFGRWRTAMISPLLLVAILASAPGRMDNLSADEDSAAGRVDAWYTGFDMFKERPLFGVGMGNFVDHNWLTAHNSFVLAMAELGSVGYFIWISALAISILMLWRVLRYSPDTTDADTDMESGDLKKHQRFAAALLYSMIAYIVTAFFLSRSYVPILYMTYGMCSALYLIARSRWPNIPEVLFKPLWKKLFALEIISIVTLRIVVSLLL